MDFVNFLITNNTIKFNSTAASCVPDSSVSKWNKTLKYKLQNYVKS